MKKEIGSNAAVTNAIIYSTVWSIREPDKRAEKIAVPLRYRYLNLICFSEVFNESGKNMFLLLCEAIDQKPAFCVYAQKIIGCDAVQISKLCDYADRRRIDIVFITADAGFCRLQFFATCSWVRLFFSRSSFNCLPKS